jgi:hypothetical protein
MDKFQPPLPKAKIEHFLRDMGWTVKGKGF